MKVVGVFFLIFFFRYIAMWRRKKKKKMETISLRKWYSGVAISPPEEETQSLRDKELNDGNRNLFKVTFSGSFFFFCFSSSSVARYSKILTKYEYELLFWILWFIEHVGISVKTFCSTTGLIELVVLFFCAKLTP